MINILRNVFLGFVVSSVFKSVLQYVIILFRKSFIVFRYIWYITIFMFCNTFLLIFDIFIFLQHSDGFDLKINFKSTKKAQPPSAELDIFYGLMCLIMGFYPTAIAFFKKRVLFFQLTFRKLVSHEFFWQNTFCRLLLLS